MYFEVTIQRGRIKDSSRTHTATAEDSTVFQVILTRKGLKRLRKGAAKLGALRKGDTASDTVHAMLMHQVQHDGTLPEKRKPCRRPAVKRMRYSAAIAQKGGKAS